MPDPSALPLTRYSSSSHNIFGAPASLLLALALLTLWRVLAAAHAAPPLFMDEAQYWDWSRQPDWGYFSKPPMVAWLIAATTALLGQGELAVRAAAFLFYPATAWMIYLIAQHQIQHYPPDSPVARTGPWIAALIFASLPMVSMGSWLMTTDAPLLFFWSGALLFYLRAIAHDRWLNWLALGCMLGLGLLSKYSMAFFFLAALSHLISSAQHRQLLTRPGPYLGVLVALVLLTPNLAWNMAHDFVSLHHTAEISQLDKALLHPEALVEFLLAQFGVFGPLTMAVLVGLSWSFPRLIRTPALAPLAWFALLPLAIFLIQALLARAFANWAAFSYVAAAPLVAFWLLEKGRTKWLVAAMVVNLAIGAVLYHWHDLARVTDVELNRKTDPYSRLLGWPEVGNQVAQRLADHPKARLLTSDRTEFCQLAYYARHAARPGYFLNPSRRISHHFALTADVAQAPDGSFIWVSDATAPDTHIALFRQARELKPIRVNVYPDLLRTYRVFLLQDFRGYPEPSVSKLP